MRPVEKWTVGHTTSEGFVVVSTYDPHTHANGILHKNLGDFCSYCEVFSSDLEVEHIVPTYRNGILRTQWTNFLLACGRCNGADNTSLKVFKN